MKRLPVKIETIALLLLGCLAYYFLVDIDAFEAIMDFTRKHEHWEFDEVLMALLVAILLLLILSVRRLLVDNEKRRKMERSLREAMEKSEELGQMKSNFLSMVSHELRTPLTAIIGFAKLSGKNLEYIFNKKQFEDDIIKKLKRIEENNQVIITEGDRLSELINNVLDIAKLESGNFDWKFIPISIHDILMQSISATRFLFLIKGIPLETQIDTRLPVVQGDYDRLVQVCINLLSNAAKFTQEGHVICSAKVEDESVVVRVQDSGIGVSPKDVEEIFEKFKQLGNTLTDKPKGTGLGLPICREIITQHNGKIWHEQNPEGGSIFAFSIPINPVEKPTVPKD